ncbi:Uncharacterized protein LW94_169 [Fusarium fujikuroi]|nr:Uncharacterized protein LW94_169 [Fusarium fujikuroi]
MDGCLCNTIHTLAKDYNEAQAIELIPALNRHLEDLRQFLAKTSSLSRQVQYQITPRNQRTDKALFVDKVDLTPVHRVFSKFENDVIGFWADSDDRVHLELRRRLACVAIFLRSKLDLQILAPPQVADVFPGVRSIADLRNPGRKYVQIAQRLGGVGAIFWLPRDVPASTSPSLKQQVWPILERLLKTCKISASLGTHVIEAVLYFCEGYSLAIRHTAVKQAKLLLRKSMPYYLHASVVLFRSILHRADGELAKSESNIRDFLWRGPRPNTRRDHALEGRLHISQMENKIRCYDTDVPSFAYKWRAQQPLSTLDMEVTFRLQSTAARYFQSIGDFDAARASLEQFLSLGRIKPIPTNSRRVLLERLSDVYCEMGEYVKAMGILEPELEHIDPSDRSVVYSKG